MVLSCGIYGILSPGLPIEDMSGRSLVLRRLWIKKIQGVWLLLLKMRW